MSKTPSLRGSLARAVEQVQAEHYGASPSHAASMLQLLEGHARGCRAALPDDPALAAYLVRDRLPYMIRCLSNLQRWSQEYIDYTPDECPVNGARLCN